VIYKIGKDGSLDGHWTHRDLQGKIATEQATGGTPGQLAGTYSVLINTPDERRVFEGSLTIAALGEAYRLTWSGRQLLPVPRDARFSGIGTIEEGDTVVATFQEDEPPDRATLRGVWEKIPGPQGERFAEAFSRGTLRVLLYAPRKTDPQTPHEQDEVYVVMKGSGTFFLDGVSRPFAEGDVLFVPAGVTHRFQEFTDDLTVWAIFYGPHGGAAMWDLRREIEHANAAFSAAFVAGDAAAVAGMYTEAARLLPPNGPIVDGRDAIERFWEGAMASGIKGVDLKTSEVEAFGDTAIESGAATLYAEHGVVADHGKYLVVWKQVEGRWKLHRDCWNSNGHEDGRAGAASS
jgi:uncharacterized protein (TIGR02246 family)